ncbi:MAG TPA: hypothetical protein VFU05_09055 [Cyclobacteriaceae bacterium]|nr:hypothetical protein [Cyclobacteriaceae bacterium]
MKLGLLVTLLLLNPGHQTGAQDSVDQNGLSSVTQHFDAERKKKAPLFIIKADNKTFQVAFAEGELMNSRKVKRTLELLNTDWIAAVDVLKGNSATEEYGSLGQNGVVIIHLKSGTSDKLPGKLKKHEIIERS